ncbi:diguanylate cyclase/phosphodiesterase [Magnetococcus marinus MC-1]|uniref:Diguanylate cyclase/phosphodiesterase n=1 Tax=Magnetococcus marinus (strain ATCC BAA-1437 / JCM 17883 / MC-1) TaxID=156889 RepID=A0L4N6_MAGMM|nr:bifunctional diguanylate cyclase/phosphodiesterase [Magnetococcus marinus]ABK42929.1 diguanylate cyclase/phosphodiesterase [Magnetococcus marinus MC-1]
MASPLFLYNPLKSIKGFILSIAVGATLLMSLSLYWVISDIYERSVRNDARKVATLMAEQTFQSMYQVMRKGWVRRDVEDFIGALRRSVEGGDYRLEVLRAPLVEELFGPIHQPALDEAVGEVVGTAERKLIDQPTSLRLIYPLLAREECLKCHTNANVGNVLGVIDVQQNLVPILRRTRAEFINTLLWIAPIPLLAAFFVALWIHGRLVGALNYLRDRMTRINKVSDLTQLNEGTPPPTFCEVSEILEQINDFSRRLQSFAVDKELLEFEIRLLERFVITSDVVKDWQNYVKQLLLEINQVMSTYALFSIFKVEEEQFDLEIFWRDPPSADTRMGIESIICTELQKNNSFHVDSSVTRINHHVARPDASEMVVNPEVFRLQIKSLVVELPKIGGIVGIGVHVDLTRDPTRILVMESTLSTLLNVVGSVKAISKYTRDLEFYATRDPLTGLYNHRILWELLRTEVERAHRHNHQFALLLVDLDNFKTINDSHGHAVGDDLLIAFADQIGATLRQGDILGRHGGDEFVIMLPEVEEGVPFAAAERILSATDKIRVQTHDGQSIGISASIGVAIFPDHANSAKDLFLFADNMMFKAKAEGKHRFTIPSEEDVVDAFKEIGEKSALVMRAIEEKWVQPFYQPIFDGHTGEVVAHEVLSRIQVPDARLYSANEFIEIAERLGVVHKLDYVGMEKAFNQAGREGYEGLLFINMSPKAMVLSEFFPTVKKMIEAAGLQKQNIVFEITERDTVRNLKNLEIFIRNLHGEGYKFAIDDFGSGFSSFHYLKRFPIDYLKIEGEFIAHMLDDVKDLAFVRSMAMLARDLGIATVGEFVESAAIAQECRTSGVSLLQGYHLGRPSAHFITNKVKV